MRVLYANEMRYGSLSATNEDANFPASNMVHRFLLKPFKATTTSSVITATFQTDRTINCIFIGYHNITSGSIALKDSGGSTISTTTLTNISGADPYVLYITESAVVRSAVITLNSTTDNLYVGCVAIGDYLQMPGMSVDASFSDIINADVTETNEGFVTGIVRSVLNQFSFTFPVVSHTERGQIKDMIDEVGTAVPFWIHPYESDTSFDPFYGRITSAGEFKKLAQGGILYSIQMTFKECS